MVFSKTCKMNAVVMNMKRLIVRSFSHYNRVVDMAANDGELRVFIVSGEVSGDSIGSRLMDSLKVVSPFPVRFAGIGGCTMCRKGLKTQFIIDDIAVMGLWELLPYLNKLRVKLKETVEAALLFKPHVVVTVDYKGFAFRFLRMLRGRCDQQGINGPVHVHYVSPSFWAWKGGEARLKGLCGFVDHILCILPFEEEICKLNGLPATFVGHPMLEDALSLNQDKDAASSLWRVRGNGESFRTKHGLSAGSTVVSLLPGSRLQEVRCMLPIFLNTIKHLNDSLVELTTIIPVAPNRHVENFISKATQTWPVPNILIPGESQDAKYDAFDASVVALTTSGSAVIELQLARLPCVVAYRAHFLTEWFIKLRKRIEFISLPNILLDSDIIPEALFQACTPANLTLFLNNLIRDEDLRQKQIVGAEKVFSLLCPTDSKVLDLGLKEGRSEDKLLSPSMIAAYTILYTATRIRR